MAEPVPQPSPRAPAGAAPQLRVLRGGAPPSGGQGAQDQPGQQGQKVHLKLPERPQLVPGVKPAGQMQGSAYVDPPWLLEREESGYVQVTELLYRIAELCDGRRSYAEIAQAVSQGTGRQVSPQNVAQLVAQQLLAKGLVLDANGKALKPPEASRSLLAINGRVSLLSPKLIDAPTKMLTPLFWPPVLVVMLGIAALGQWWLFTQHGIGGGLHQALYQPALLLPLFAVLALSAAFHEFGHATALRYGGGKVRGMGAGMYLVYPVLYTDVSDNYRLPRWSRIRTDLGGFYFNLLFSLALMGLYAATGSEFLLVVVALINLDIVKQLMPFVRLDGYWTLVDLTGMPDFFSQMGSFLKGLVPGRRHEEQGAQAKRELKWWAKAVFLLYILITIPFLFFAGFMMVRSAPRILATGLDSASKQLASAEQANAAGDLLSAAGALGSVALVSIPMLGVLYALYRLGKGAFGLITRFSHGSALKRAVGSVVAAALATGVVMLWLPMVPGLNRPGPLYSPEAFTPIQPNERLTLADVRTGAITDRATGEVLPARGASTPAAGTAVASTPAAGTPAAGTPAAVTPTVAGPAGGVPTAAASPAGAGTAAGSPTATVRPATTAGPAPAVPAVGTPLPPTATARPASTAPAAASSPSPASGVAPGATVTAAAQAPAATQTATTQATRAATVSGTALASPTRVVGAPTATSTATAAALR